MSQKTIHIKIPLPLFEEFHRVFPGWGEKTAILRRLIGLAVELEKEKDCFMEKIKEEIGDD